MKIKRLAVFFIIIIIFSSISYYVTENSKFEKIHGKIISIIDADTLNIEINNKTEKIRLKGINTPEKSEFLYNEINNYVSKFKGEEVKVLYLKDKKYDKYSRILGYVFIDGFFLNNNLIEKGYAHVYYYDKDRYINDLINKEKQARDFGLGIWKKSEHICSSCIKLIILNQEEEFFILENSCLYDCDLKNWQLKDEATHLFKLDFEIKARQVKAIFSKDLGIKNIWNNDKDSFFLRDDEGGLVLFYRY